MARVYLILLVSAICFLAASGQSPSCDQTRACYPATGDLLIGRQDRLKASSTCGVRRKQRYCIVSHLEDPKKCFVCDSRQPYQDNNLLYNMSHRIENIVSSPGSRDWKKRWWQAENGQENVQIRLDLEAEFHFTHLVMKFKTFRPAAMFIERSHDFGKTWQIYRYFAHDCAESFPGIRRGPVRRITDVICESRYSNVAPSTGGEVILRALPPFVQVHDPYSEEVQDLLKMTNLRINFTKLHTLGDDKLDSRTAVKEKYYYSMFDMVVRGSCSCYGHASRCLPLPGQGNVPDMVYGRCECTHNTKSLNCHECEDFYNDQPWRPAHGRDINACKRCECNNHANSCHFDAAIYEATGRVSGGVCDECLHNTMGRKCEMCRPFYYQDPTEDISSPTVCKSCNCDPVGSEHGGECEGRTDIENSLIAGRCICKRYVEGLRCGQCMNGFWNLQSDNPEGCQACTCSTLGTIGNFGCDKRTGTCRCKRFVTGRLCDRCLDNYWGMSDEVDGCRPCDCDAGGAYDHNCDQVNGQCRCRPNVVGRRCDKPASGYFVPDLDYMKYEGEFAIGSVNTRVVIREPQVGRPITWTGPGFMRVSEGDTLEFTVDDIPLSTEYDIIIRYEPQMPERWTDVRVTVVRPEPVVQEGPCGNTIPHDDSKAANLPQEVYRTVATLSFSNYDEDGSGEVDYDSRFFLYDDIKKEGVPEYKTFRTNYVSHVDDKGQFMEVWDVSEATGVKGSRHYLVVPTTCLESGKTYKIRLEFNRYRGDRTTPQASVLIDSIVLMANPERIPIFEGPGIPARMKEEFQRHMCRELQMSIVRQQMSDLCKKYIFSISASIQNMAVDCQCDPTGSQSGVCDPIGGQCQCKPNVLGRRCDQCSPGTYGFGPEGCRACNCNAIGARDNFCDAETGSCVCTHNVFGQQCDQCQTGFWNFPRCQPCSCNGRADSCDNENGYCDVCRDNTGGNNCELCAPGYYGDPTPGSFIGCRACMCPGGVGSGYQNGDTCRLNTLTNRVICDCKQGYAGVSCERCDDNHYGNPLVAGGSCERCLCNGNIDTGEPGSCDPNTGECLKCLYNTEGFGCERCREGYWGDAQQHNCQSCVCNILGTDRDGGNCDERTGQCPCLPNVAGRNCDKCAANHWKIASGLGCEHCRCDPDGSLSDQCNAFDGKCECKPGRGGRDCSECQDFYWGDPNRRCYPCNCDGEGSSTRQCDRRTGECQCIAGVTGDKCDRCDRGTTGNLPYCQPCGECFDNWDRIIMDLKNETNIWLEKGSKITYEGAPGAFEKEFDEMEAKLNEVKNIISGTNVTSDDLEDITKRLEEVKRNLTTSQDEIDTLNIDLQDTADRVQNANDRIADLSMDVDDVKKMAQDLEKNATDIKQKEVTGAFNLTMDSLSRSREAQKKVDDTSDILQDSENTRQTMRDLIDRSKDAFEKKYDENEQNLDMLEDNADSIDEKITDLNEKVCGGRGDPCDEYCGGAGCGKCGGGLSCGDSVVNKANDGLDYAKDAEDLLKKKKKELEDLLAKLLDVNDNIDMSKSDAQMAYDTALAAKNQSEGARADIQDMLQKITHFLTEKGARPSEIRAVADEVLAMKISLTPEQIQDLAQQINETIQGLTAIDDILQDTKDDLVRVQKLRDRATKAETEAEDVLDTAEQVLVALKEAREAQNEANDAIDKATDDISDAEGDLTQIESETSQATDQSNETLYRVYDLKARLKKLQYKFIENERDVEKAEMEAQNAEQITAQAEEDADTLEEKYAEASEILNTKYNETQEVKSQADLLRERARKLFLTTKTRLDSLTQMEDEFMRYEELIVKLDVEISGLYEKMVQLVIDISGAENFLRYCS